MAYDCLLCLDTGWRYVTSGMSSGEDKFCDCQREKPMPTAKVRTFKTGATRDTDKGKNDYEGYLSPKALKRFGDYMTENRVQSDGKVRDSDNWQKGIPQEQYIKSLLRHVIELWDLHRDGLFGKPLEDALCGIIFNAQGYLHEELKGETYELGSEAAKFHPFPITPGD